MIHRRSVLMISLAIALSAGMSLVAPVQAGPQTAQQSHKPTADYPYATAWLLRRSGQETEVVHGGKLAQTTQTPASTIKPLLALIALQTGVLRDADELVPWDGRHYPGQKQWEKEMKLAEAMQTSSESYFRLLADRIGRDRLATWVARVGYGNGKIGDQADRAWHAGVLTITAHQQLDFIDRLRRADLPFDRRNLDIVKATMLSFEKNGVRIYGKTGTSLPPGKTGLGWWIGWVERGDEQTSFVLQSELTKFDGRDLRMAYANQLLLEAGILSELP